MEKRQRQRSGPLEIDSGSRAAELKVATARVEAMIQELER
jgi:hypothetical protein